MFLAGVKPESFVDARKALGGTYEAWRKGPLSEAAGGWKADDDLLYMLNDGLVRGGWGAETMAQRAPIGRQGAQASGVPGARFRQAIESEGVIGAAATQAERIPVAGRVLGAPLRGAQKVGEWAMLSRVYAEELARVAYFKQLRKQGFSREAAREELIRHFGKVNELSGLERSLGRHIQMVWMWRKNSLPITLRAILDKPVRSRMLMTAMAGDQDDPAIAEWARRSGGPTLGTDKSGNIRMYGLMGGTWFSPTFNLFNSDFMAAVKRASTASPTMVEPMVRVHSQRPAVMIFILASRNELTNSPQKYANIEASAMRQVVPKAIS
jgi:hypothetical protein